MRVKRLEIQGFKSFKDKTVIHFDHTITGIVGPNGCGKSNIVDAFFWVMGEQSYKHMRGNSSEDLIFNGSSKYSPMGVAEATLVMETGVIDTENAPAGATTQDVPIHLRSKEISVTRRLYRSGEGEYFINGTQARLKDIQELFMDTGVGAKGYSVIEQGQIGKIVNAKPEERRLLVEEAAGIAKYKARKKESLRKMEATQANLSRLTDIIQEIERNLASLERQAQKARQYKKYKDELFAKEITWGRRKCKILRNKLDLLRQDKERLEQDLIAIKAELQVSENSIEVERISLVTETKLAEELQIQIQDLAHELSENRSALELSKRRQGDLSSQLEALENEQDQLTSSVEADRIKLHNLEEQMEEAQQLYQKASAEVTELNALVITARKEVDQARHQVDTIQRELMQRVKKVSDLNSKLAGLQSKAELANVQIERLTEQESGQFQKIEDVASELEKAKAQIETFHSERDLLRIKREEQNAQLEEEEDNYLQLEKDKNQALRTLTETQSKLESLEELDQSHEGLADGPKAALEWAKANQKGNLLHALTDLLNVTPGYESALETWLENRLEHLITYDSDLAFPLLEQLKSKKQGRIGLQLVLQKTGPSETSSKSKNAPLSKIKSTFEEAGIKVLGELSTFVQPNNPDAKNIKQLFENVCLIESAASLAVWLKQNGTEALEGWAIVSMDGVALEPKGTLRGGSQSNSGAVAILRRKKLIEELHAQLEEAQNRHSDLENDVFQSKERRDLLRNQLKTIQTEYQQLEIKVASADRDIHQIERSKREAQNQLERIQRDITEMRREAERAQSDREALELNLKEVGDSNSELENELAQANEALTQKDEHFRSQDQSLQSLRVNEASLREKSQGLKKEREAVFSVMNDRERRIQEIQRVFERASQEKAQFSGGESELAEKIEELTVELTVTREKLSGVKDLIEQANAKINGTLEKTKSLHKQNESKSSETTQLALDIEKLLGELSHLTLNLEDKYGAGCLQESRALQSSENQQATEDSETQEGQETLAAPAEEETISAEEELALNEEVERLKERIRRLGEVNVMAIEEFEELKKRYDHILKEKVDLEHSLQNLKDAIEHINKTSEERFKKAFEAIAERFEKLFPIIFGGGQAKLSLVYPEGSTEILDAGVDILAQPPGKKVTNIGLLSGGEKALTAVSLIFAIFMVKPSPFCVLDEVDAPLDDANIGRFNALLREMSSKSQFILITHNKKTMELNDTLYGVTMEEPGVSKMVSIELH